MEKGQHTYEEIHNQSAAWAQALQVVQSRHSELEAIASESFSQVIFTGCGSSYYLSLSAAATLQELTGKPVRAVPAGELLFNPETVLTGDKTLLVASSRSGRTTETVKAVETFRSEKRGPVVVISNDGNQPLAGLADLAFIIEKGQEISVAQTRSLASMLVTATALCALYAGREDLFKAMSSLPQKGEQVLKTHEPLAKHVGGDPSFDRYYFLGSGIKYGLACEASLKMKEMALTHCEAFHVLEFRHGPMSMVSNSAVVVGLLSDRNRKVEQPALEDMKALGGSVISLAEAGATVEFKSQVPEAVRAVLHLPFVQLLAWYRSQVKGLDPDQPEHLFPVVLLNI